MKILKVKICVHVLTSFIARARRKMDDPFKLQIHFVLFVQASILKQYFSNRLATLTFSSSWHSGWRWSLNSLLERSVFHISRIARACQLEHPSKIWKYMTWWVSVMMRLSRWAKLYLGIGDHLDLTGKEMCLLYSIRGLIPAHTCIYLSPVMDGPRSILYCLKNQVTTLELVYFLPILWFVLS